ncbi:MAG: hypothetical protein A2901_03390 [Elusimicrobia bacterium RIFCSPLOWO2_01_FULL_54_10]|nr:MAG: hypothetical protein A2901_03390 [Elusimicrobia bacterium RIFCSPLOWO2_01_FULL_54_10]
MGASSLLLAAASLGMAADSDWPGTGVGHSTGTLSDTLWTANESTIAEKLSNRYQVSRSTYTMEQLHQKLGDWNDVVTALVITQKASQKIDNILNLRKSGLDWDQISRYYNVSRDDVRHEVESVKKDINKNNK